MKNDYNQPNAKKKKVRIGVVITKGAGAVMQDEGCESVITCIDQDAHQDFIYNVFNHYQQPENISS